MANWSRCTNDAHTRWPAIIMSNGARGTIWIFPSVCRHSARQKCGLKCSATFALVKHVSSAQMEEPPRMIPGLHNAVSCPRSAKCGWLSHPWPKCRFKCDEFFMQLKYMYLPLSSFSWIDFFRRLVKSEGCNGSFWPEKGPTSVWPPPHMSVISYTLPSTKINLQIWKPPNDI